MQDRHSRHPRHRRRDPVRPHQGPQHRLYRRISRAISASTCARRGSCRTTRRRSSPRSNALRARYDYVFTTGGIGPTHDDITADAVAKAFGVAIDEDPRAMAIMLERYKPADLTPARRRMARIPDGAELVDNPVSKAPGFRIGNVIVMAGVPSVMQAMLDDAVKGLRTGGRSCWSRRSRRPAFPEGRYGDALGRDRRRPPEVSIGSYPSYADGTFQQSDRRARQGRRGGRRRAARGRGDDRGADAATASRCRRDERPVPDRRPLRLEPLQAGKQH